MLLLLLLSTVLRLSSAASVTSGDRNPLAPVRRFRLENCNDLQGLLKFSGIDKILQTCVPTKNITIEEGLVDIIDSFELIYKVCINLDDAPYEFRIFQGPFRVFEENEGQAVPRRRVQVGQWTYQDGRYIPCGGLIDDDPSSGSAATTFTTEEFSSAFKLKNGATFKCDYKPVQETASDYDFYRNGC